MKDIKIKLNNHVEFQKAWIVLMAMGYHTSDDLVPHTAPYLYAYSDGLVRPDFFDVGGADLSSPKSAEGHFAAHKHEEITLDELLKLANLSEDDVNYQIQINELDNEISELKELFIEENHFSNEEDERLESIITKAIQYGMLCAKRDALVNKAEHTQLTDVEVATQ